MILETVDAIKTELTVIEATCLESGAGYDDLFNRLKQAAVHPTTLEPVQKVPELTQPDPIKAETPKLPVIMEALPQEAEPVETAALTGPSLQAFEKDPSSPTGKSLSVADSTIRVDVPTVGPLDESGG